MHTTFQEGGVEGTLGGDEWDRSCGVGGAGGRGTHLLGRVGHQLPTGEGQGRDIIT